MVKIEESVIVDRSAEEVWKFVADPSNLPKWNPAILEVKQTSSGPPGVGTTLLARSRGMALDIRVIEYQPSRKFAFEGTSGPLRGTTNTFSMETIEGKTRLTRTVDMKLNGLYRLVGPFATRRAKREVSAGLSNVKRLLDSGA
jgi:carbon monoxide dehydrogenase subunit G